VSLWFANPEKVLILASQSKLEIDYCDLQNKFLWMNRDNKLSSIGIMNQDKLIGHLLLNTSEIIKYAGDAEDNTDDRPVFGYNDIPVSQLTDAELFKSLISASVEFKELVLFKGGCSASAPGVIMRIEFYNHNYRKQLEKLAGIK
jgi:hypothetical protein